MFGFARKKDVDDLYAEFEREINKMKGLEDCRTRNWHDWVPESLGYKYYFCCKKCRIQMPPEMYSIVADIERNHQTKLVELAQEIEELTKKKGK